MSQSASPAILKQPKYQPSFISKRRIFLAGVVIALVGLGGRYWRSQRGEKISYQTATAEKGTLISSISASGVISSARLAFVRTTLGGTVEQVYVKNGDTVKAGDALVKLVPDQESAAKRASAYSSYLQAKNTLDAANSTLFTLQSQLFAANQEFINGAVAENLAATDPTYIQAQANWLAAESKYKNQHGVIAQARASMQSAWLSYQQTNPTVSSPIGGKVTAVSIQKGDVFSSQTTGGDNTASAALVTISSSNTPTVTVNVSQIDIPSIRVDQKATITLDAFVGKTFTGKVSAIDTAGWTSSGVTTYSVRITFDTENEQIYPNMAATARIITDSKSDALFVPNAAISTVDGVTRVRRLRDGNQEPVEVQIGISSDTHTEIISGLSPGDEVITGTNSSSTPTNRTTRTSVFGGGNRQFAAPGGAVMIQRTR